MKSSDLVKTPRCPGDVVDERSPLHLQSFARGRATTTTTAGQATSVSVSSRQHRRSVRAWISYALAAECFADVAVVSRRPLARPRRRRSSSLSGISETLTSPPPGSAVCLPPSGARAGCARASGVVVAVVGVVRGRCPPAGQGQDWGATGRVPGSTGLPGWTVDVRGPA